MLVMCNYKIVGIKDNFVCEKGLHLGLCLKTLFELVNIDSIVNLLLLMLLEEKILLVSNRITLLPVCSTRFLKLLFLRCECDLIARSFSKD